MRATTPACAGLGVGVSFLLRQPGGFEGVTPTDEGVNPSRLPVSLLNQVSYRSLEDDAASAPLSFWSQQDEVTLVAEIDHALRSPVDLRKTLGDLVEQFPETVLTPEGSLCPSQLAGPVHLYVVT